MSDHYIKQHAQPCGMATGRVLIVSLGLLAGGVAHAARDGLAEDCRPPLGGDHAAAAQRMPSPCDHNTPGKSVPGGGGHPLFRDLRPPLSAATTAGRDSAAEPSAAKIPSGDPGKPTATETAQASGHRAAGAPPGNGAPAKADGAEPATGNSEPDAGAVQADAAGAQTGAAIASETERFPPWLTGQTDKANRSTPRKCSAAARAPEAPLWQRTLGSTLPVWLRAPERRDLLAVYTAQFAATDPQTLAAAQSSGGAPGPGTSGVAPQQSTELFITEVQTPESAQGEEGAVANRDLFNLGFSSQHTTDDFDIRTYTLSYRNHRRDWFWPWQEATTRKLDWGLNVDRTDGDSGALNFHSVRVLGTVGAYLTPGTYLKGQLGRHTLHTDAGDRTISPYRLTAMFGLGRDFGYQLETHRDFIFTGGAVPGGITEQLTARTYSGAFRWRPQHRLRILGQSQYSRISDANSSRDSTLSVLYGISADWPWVWAGVGGERLTYDQQVPSYWTPSRFTAYGLRLDSNFPLAKRLQASAAVNLDRIDEDGAQGTGYYLDAGLQYRIHKQLYGRLELTQSKSIQSASTWTANTVFLRLSGPLF